METSGLTDLYPEDVRRSLAARLYHVIRQWETRIVRVEPGNPTEPLVLSLVPAVILEQNALGLHDDDLILPYEALSYTWGSSIFSHAVVCNGVDFSVTENLHAALVHLRRNEGERWIWIDALCINQYDLSEKARQIRSLYMIFKKAEQTLVWLGEAGPEATKTVEFMLEVERHPGSRRYDDEARRRFLAIRNDIFGRAWFSRVWIIQEIAASEDYGKIKVYYGSCVMSLGRPAHDLKTQRIRYAQTPGPLARCSGARSRRCIWSVFEIPARCYHKK